MIAPKSQTTGLRIFPVLFLVLLGLVGATTTAPSASSTSTKTIISSSLPCSSSMSPPPATEKGQPVLVPSFLVVDSESRRVARVFLDQLLKQLQQDSFSGGTPLEPAGACATAPDTRPVDCQFTGDVSGAVDNTIQRHLRALCEDIQQNPSWDDEDDEVAVSALPSGFGIFGNSCVRHSDV